MISIPPRPADFQFAEAKSPRLRITTYSSAAFACTIRGLTQKGLIQTPFTTDGLRTAQNTYVQLTEIPLAVFIETSTAAVQRGRLYAQIFLEFAGVSSVLLAADYITTGQPASWPEGGIHSPTEGRGYLWTYIGTDPPATGEIEETVPNNTLWHIKGLTYQFLTSAVVANRTSRLALWSEYGDMVLITTPNAVQAAGNNMSYFWHPYLAVPAAFDVNIFGYHSPAYLRSVAAITTVTENMQAGDNYNAPEILIEEWLNP
jgi:hypothetical protein